MSELNININNESKKIEKCNKTYDEQLASCLKNYKKNGYETKNSLIYESCVNRQTLVYQMCLKNKKSGVIYM
jgi:hypothetical protein